jgi:hypothetical protein
MVLSLAFAEALPPALARRPALGPLRYLAHRDAGRLDALADASLLKRDYLRTLGDNTARLARTGQILDVAAAAGVTLLPYKGVLLAEAVYGDAGTRPMADIDLLVRPRDLAVVEAALAGIGFRRMYAVAGPRLRPPFAHDLALFDGRHTLELHFRWLHDLGVHADVEPIFARAVELELLGRSRPVPSWSDHLMMVAVHAASHSFALPMWLVDVALLAARAGGFAEAAERAAACRAERAFAVAVTLAGRALPGQLPPLVLPRRGVGRARWLAPLLARTFAAPPSRAATLAAKLLMTDRASAAVAMVTSRVAVVLEERLRPSPARAN